MLPLRLAQELLDSIVDQVQDRGILKESSLVARSFVVRSQRRLFRSLCVFSTASLDSHPEGTDALSGFTSFENAQNLLTMSPHLVGYVRDVHLGFNSLSMQSFVREESVLRVLSQVTLLAIFTNGHRSLFWQEFPATLSSLLRDIVTRPSVRSLMLECALLVHSLSIIPFDFTSPNPAHGRYHHIRPDFGSHFHSAAAEGHSSLR
ncbi:hypothetical protein C8R44DRAFT_890479 [Mycena epipterygia]|nr:hypothetical protein C8R44DRAFT_890479 [Mycena epipterygia]